MRFRLMTAGVLMAFAASCGGSSGKSTGAGGDAGTSSGTGGSSGSGTAGAGMGGAGTGGTGAGDAGAMCFAHADYNGLYYVRATFDDDVLDALRTFIDSPSCFSLEIAVDSAASTVTTTTAEVPPDGTSPQMFMGTLTEGEDVVISIASPQIGLVDITIGCDGTASVSAQYGPIRLTCSGSLPPTGGSLQCEVLGPGGPIGLADIVVGTDALDAAECTPPPVVSNPPDCSTDLPLSPEVGGACGSACTVDQGGACTGGQCLAVCVDSEFGCSLHCGRDESCLPLTEGGQRVMVDIGGTQYPAGACTLESGPRQAYETCGSDRCDGYNCLGFAGINTVGMCTPECFGDDSDCPSGPPGFTPVCTLTDATRRTFCGLTCDPTRPEETCPPNFTCLPPGTNPGVAGIDLVTKPVCLPIRP